MRQHRFDEFDLAKIFDRRSVISTRVNGADLRVVQGGFQDRRRSQPDDENVLRLSTELSVWTASR